MKLFEDPDLRRLFLGFFVAGAMRLTNMVSNVFEATTIMLSTAILLHVSHSRTSEKKEVQS